MPAPSEKDQLIATKKRLDDDAKAMRENPTLQNPENVANGVLQAKLSKIEAHKAEIDARLNEIDKPAK